MTSYDNHLPPVFPYGALVTEEEARNISRLLSSSETRYDHGSSFAVTSDAYILPGGKHMRRLWLSAASNVRVRRAYPHIEIRPSYDEGE